MEIRADSLARFVELTFDSVDVVFSYNYFDLPRRRFMTVSAHVPTVLSTVQAHAALKIRSLFNT